jgi:hypothetical protein
MLRSTTPLRREAVVRDSPGFPCTVRDRRVEQNQWPRSFAAHAHCIELKLERISPVDDRHSAAKSSEF